MSAPPVRGAGEPAPPGGTAVRRTPVPLISLAQRLCTDHEVSFATGPARLELLTQLGFPAHPVLGDDPSALERIADTDRQVGSNPLRLLGQLRQNLAILPQARADLDALLHREQPDLVLADFTAPVAGWAAQAAGIGWLTTIPTPFAIETRSGTPSYVGGWAEATHLGHRLRDAAGRLSTRAFKLGVQRWFAEELAALGTRVYRPDGTEAVYSPEGILGLGVPELEFDRDWPPGFRFIGPVTESPLPGPIPALPTQRPLILVTLGTHLWWAKDDLVAGAAALAAALGSHDLVITLGRPGSSVLREVAPGVLLADYLPYDEILHRFEMVIHHGGAGVSYSTLRAGLPALVWPHDYDQFDFAARLVGKGAALRITDLASPATLGAARQALSGLPGVARLSEAVRASDPYRATAAAVAERLSR